MVRREGESGKTRRLAPDGGLPDCCALLQSEHKETGFRGRLTNQNRNRRIIGVMEMAGFCAAYF